MKRPARHEIASPLFSEIVKALRSRAGSHTSIIAFITYGYHVRP